MKFLIMLSLIFMSSFSLAGNDGKFKLEFSSMAGFDYTVEFLLSSKHKVKIINESDYISMYAVNHGSRKILNVIGPGDEDFVKVRLHLDNNLLISSCAVDIDAKNEYLAYLGSSYTSLYRWSKNQSKYVLLEPNNSEKDSALCKADIISGYDEFDN